MFSVPAAYGRELKIDQSVEIRIGISDRLANGNIEFVSPTANPQSGTVRVRVRVPNPDEALPSGTNCRLILDGYGDRSGFSPVVSQR